uniref:AbiH family protein n=1 Tax=Lactococcus garvieae TaxID=1363 RepID=UPI00359C27A7
MEQLIILGNGFDLACNLKSKYENFYRYLFDEEYQNFLKNFMSHISKYQKFSSDVGYFSSLVDSMNVWEIIFYHYENVILNTWTDVEQTISKHLVGLYYACVYRDDYYGSWKDYNLANPDFSETTRLYNTYYEPITKLLYYKINEDSYSLSDEDFLSEEEQIKSRWMIYKRILLDDLKEFESKFAEYLKHESEAMFYRKSVNKLFTKVIKGYDAEGTNGNRTEGDLITNVLSFNYTEVETFDKDEKIPLNEYRNVHGKLSNETEGTIFGIDLHDLKNIKTADGNEQVKLFLEFTKTFRTLKMANTFGVKKLYSKRTKQIKFYGHGLGEADYSYFLSIFDSVNLYSGETTLIFFYNPQIEDEEEKQFNRVSNLILKYAETLKNENHGDNLLHKLILENRVKILPLDFNPGLL